MNKLIIIGAGNVGGFLAHNLNEFGSYELLGFLDDDPAKHHKNFYGYPVLGGIDHLADLQGFNNLSVVIGISSPPAKAIIAERLQQFNVDYPNFIAKNVWLSQSVQVGKGIILYPGVSVNYETIIGNFVIMNMNCAIGHNCTVQEYATLAPGVNLGGFTVIEREVNVGIGVSTKQNIRLGAGSQIGGQSMIVKNVEPGAKIVGVPGRVVQ